MLVIKARLASPGRETGSHLTFLRRAWRIARGQLRIATKENARAQVSFAIGLWPSSGVRWWMTAMSKRTPRERSHDLRGDQLRQKVKIIRRTVAAKGRS